MEENYFMGQGSYGCVYRKQLKCINKRKQKQTKEPRLSKLQRSKRTAEREIEVSTAIRKIRNFQLYYSPVLSSCNVDLAQLSKPDISKCDFIKEPTTTATMFTTETKYIYGENMNKYMKIAAKHPNIGNKIMLFNTLLINSVKKMAEHNIIHYDLNDGNVLIDTTDRPIIIDFGLSILLKKRNQWTEEYAKKTFFFYPFTKEGALESYEPWAVEIAINSFLVQKIGWNKTITEPYLEAIKSVSDRYIDGIKFNVSHQKTLSAIDIQTYKTKKHLLIDKFLNKKVKDIVQDLTEASYHVWDIYAVGIMTSKYMNFYCPNAITPEIAETLKSQILF